MYKIAYITQHREYSQCFIITIWSITFKNCEPLCRTHDTHIILYINSTIPQFFKKVKALLKVHSESKNGSGDLLTNQFLNRFVT